MRSDSAVMIMEKSMDALWQRNRVILDNISNATTPGYKRKEVKFESLLDNVLKTSAASSRGEILNRISVIEPEVVRDLQTTINVDGNNVDSDKEFTELYRATEQYQYMERLLNDSYARLRYAITEGRG